MTNQQKQELMNAVRARIKLGYADTLIVKVLSGEGYCAGTVRKYCKVARSRLAQE